MMKERYGFVRRMFYAAIVCAALISAASAALVIDTVPVGNAGNPAGGTGYGSVTYAYSIGKYEVTAGQYTAFLNAVAATDSYGLYNANMWSNSNGCKILRSGTSGSYTYSVAANYANRPVNYVNWGDAARFANWLHNGQPIGGQNAQTTEDGAYVLHGAMANAELVTIHRSSNWKWAIPTENEWYKAAYHKNDGATGNYWLYPVASDTINVNKANYANYLGHTTDVGSYLDSPGAYGTFDQGGNLWEWNEAITGSYRGFRGGSTSSMNTSLQSTSRDNYIPSYETYLLGFRVVQIPEPIAITLWTLGGLILRRRCCR